MKNLLRQDTGFDKAIVKAITNEPKHPELATSASGNTVLGPRCSSALPDPEPTATTSSSLTGYRTDQVWKLLGLLCPCFLALTTPNGQHVSPHRIPFILPDIMS